MLARERLEAYLLLQRIVSGSLVRAFESWVEFTIEHREVSLVAFSGWDKVEVRGIA